MLKLLKPAGFFFSSSVLTDNLQNGTWSRSSFIPVSGSCDQWGTPLLFHINVLFRVRMIWYFDSVSIIKSIIGIVLSLYLQGRIICLVFLSDVSIHTLLRIMFCSVLNRISFYLFSVYSRLFSVNPIFFFSFLQLLEDFRLSDAGKSNVLVQLLDENKPKVSSS